MSSVKGKEAVEKEVIVLAEGIIDGLGRCEGHRLRKRKDVFTSRRREGTITITVFSD